MYRARSPIVLALLTVALVAVPAAFAKGRDHRAIRVQGVCTQQSTSKLKLSREDGRIEVEFEVDQNLAGVPWTVTLSRNDTVLDTFTVTTQAPSGSFEIKRFIRGRVGADHITAVATDAAGETCTADSAAAKVKTAPPTTTPAPVANNNDDNDNNDDRGGDEGGHHGGDDGGHSGSDS